MTEMQRICLTLHEQGRTIKEVAQMVHRAPSSVHAALQRAQRSVTPPKEAKRCKYSDSCFTCPMPDCVRSDDNINLLPADFDYFREMRNQKGANAE